MLRPDIAAPGGTIIIQGFVNFLRPAFGKDVEGLNLKNGIQGYWINEWFIA
jgi:hypothetical protein